MHIMRDRDNVQMPFMQYAAFQKNQKHVPYLLRKPQRDGKQALVSPIV